MTYAQQLQGQLLPYRGQELDRLERVGQSHVQRVYGQDRSGQRAYRFNRLGYRSAELNPAASHRVFAFGESHAFGYFVDHEQCWPSRFVDLWANDRELDRQDICFLSFADAGASNGNIARSVVSQCSALRPDLVLVHFADPRRSEVILNGIPHRVGSWLLQEEAELAAREAPGELPETLLEMIRRGRSFFRFALGSEESEWFGPAVDPTCLAENLRDILLVQSFCRAEKIRLVATCEQIELLLAARQDPNLGPLVRQLDPEALSDFGIWSVDGDLSEDPGHVGPQRHARFAQAMFDFYLRRERSSAAPSPPATPPPATLENPALEDPVASFYRELPFNLHGDVESAARSIASNVLPDYVPDVHRLLDEGQIATAADCGCGAGWLTCSLALHYGLEVTGIDYTAVALERAREVAEHLGVASQVHWIEADLLELVDPGGFDLVLSHGVLHHLPDARQGFDRIEQMVRPGGFLSLALYHEPGRQPFLEHFRGLVSVEEKKRRWRSFVASTRHARMRCICVRGSATKFVIRERACIRCERWRRGWRALGSSCAAQASTTFNRSVTPRRFSRSRRAILNVHGARCATDDSSQVSSRSWLSVQGSKRRPCLAA